MCHGAYEYETRSDKARHETNAPVGKIIVIMETAYIISDESDCHHKRSRTVIHCDDDAAQVLIVAFQILHNLVDKQQLRAIRNMSF